MCKNKNRLWIYELADQKYEYCFLSGKFRYRACNLNQKRLWGHLAGSKTKAGYVALAFKLDKKKHRVYAHRLAVYLLTGEMPNNVVHHIDGNPSNNRITNLQACSQLYNNSVDRWKFGKTSKYTGVSLHENIWRSQITISGKNHCLGHFKSEKKAAAAYQKALQELEVN